MQPDEKWYANLGLELVEGTVTPFLGAGVNMVGVDPLVTPFEEPGDRLPSGTELARYLAEKRRIDAGEPPELIKVAQYLFSDQGWRPLYADLHGVFDHDFRPTAVHEALALMPEYVRRNHGPYGYPLMITTNYDDALERAFRARGEPFDVLSYVAIGKSKGRFVHFGPDGDATLVRVGRSYQGINLKERPVILKLHGAVVRAAARSQWAEDSYVITEDDYIESMTADVLKALPAAVSARMQACHYLFLGYSLRDWNLRAMLHRIWKDHEKEYKSWAIERRANEGEEKAWKDRDVDMFELDLGYFARSLSGVLGNQQAEDAVR